MTTAHVEKRSQRTEVIKYEHWQNHDGIGGNISLHPLNVPHYRLTQILQYGNNKLKQKKPPHSYFNIITYYI